VTALTATNSSPLPLRNLTVVELHAIGPVPFAGQILRSLGAKVFRVSPPNDPGLGVPSKRKFDLLNAGKTALLLDLKTSADMDQLHAHLAKADVLLEGFRPGVLERLGLAPASLATQHPKLVVGRLSGWGEAGPLSARAGHDINYLAMTGVLHAIGSREQPIAPLNLVADFGGGAMHLLVGILAKLVERSLDPQGKGGCVTTSITAGTIGLTPMFYGMLASGAWNLLRHNNILDGGTPFYTTYPCADGKHVAVGALEPKFFTELLAVTGLEAAIPRETQYKAEGWPAMHAAFSACFASKTRDEWGVLAQDRDACLSPVLDFLEASQHPQLQANQWFPSQDSVTNGTEELIAPRNILQFQ
jgi:alpha-methylacyl-CoA racemase